VLRSDKTIDFRIFPERVRPGDDICLVLDRDAAVKVSFQGRIWYEKDRPARYIPLTLPAKTRGIGVKIEVECLDQPCKGERVIQWSE
jgi:hypothetical protein